MNQRILLPALLSIFLVSSALTAQQTANSTDTRLATILRLPMLTPQDWQDLFSEAESGNAQSQYWLGRIYEGDTLVPKDDAKALRWFERSAEQGYAPAEYAVCGRHTNGDSLEAERCMWRAAEKGVPEAQFWIGIAYDQHLWFGITDKQKAMKWITKAAEGGCVDAQNELGQHYEDGDGVDQNYLLAAQWYRKAAEHVPNRGGAGQGRNNLGNLYSQGLGVPKDNVQAYMWYSLAEIPAQVASAAADMTPAQILQAEQLAVDWKKQHVDPAIY